MKRHLSGRDLAVLGLFTGALVLACSDDEDDRPGAFVPSGGSGTSSGGKGSGARGGSTSGDAGEASGGELSQGGEQGMAGGGPGCGNGLQEDAEECDDTDFAGTSCLDYGFDQGTLACASNCTIDSSDCNGVEHCGDGRDNDGDGAEDCGDTEDCEATCTDPCTDPPVLGDPGEVEASTVGRGQVLSSACSAVDDVSGPDLVYQFTAANTGTLEIEFESNQTLDVVVRSACSEAEVELDCSNDFLSLPVTAGEDVFIIVDGHAVDDAGSFTLRALSRPNNVCGDGYRDSGEGCDDGDTEPLDGCDDSCEVEVDESESNDDAASADTYSAGFAAEISPEGDEDFVEVTLTTTPSSIRARSLDFWDECERGDLDSLVQIIDTDGTTVLESDDDGGIGTCSDAIATGLDAGTYYVRVAAAPLGTTPVFPYRLDVVVEPCGNGLLGPGEECDDGDTTGGDGCSATCQNE
jgi:cysteine-rich repeat protein